QPESIRALLDQRVIARHSGLVHEDHVIERPPNRRSPFHLHPPYILAWFADHQTHFVRRLECSLMRSRVVHLISSIGSGTVVRSGALASLSCDARASSGVLIHPGALMKTAPAR